MLRSYRNAEHSNNSCKITVHLMDYRDALLRPEWESAFDAVVSIEMVEVCS